MSLVGKTTRAFLIAVEGVRFLWATRKATPDYWRWRLGTVYGTFYRPSEDAPSVFAHRRLRELWKDVWRDVVRQPSGIFGYLLWRREMRRLRHRP